MIKQNLNVDGGDKLNSYYAMVSAKDKDSLEKEIATVGYSERLCLDFKVKNIYRNSEIHQLNLPEVMTENLNNYHTAVVVMGE